jgi:hypothetical protein
VTRNSFLNVVPVQNSQDLEKMQKFIDEEFGRIEGEWQGSSGYQWDFE